MNDYICCRHDPRPTQIMSGKRITTGMLLTYQLGKITFEIMVLLFVKSFVIKLFGSPQL
jgi:hypothetical protein